MRIIKSLYCNYPVYAVQQILDKGFDLLSPNSIGKTGYYFAVLTKSESLSKMLFKTCPDPNLQTKNGEMLIHTAAKHNRLHAVQILLEKGANPNSCDKNGTTPLHLAASDNHVEICRLLLAAGARKDATVKEGHWAGTGKTP